MRIALWVVQIVLALAFGMGGFMKLTFPLEELATGMDWVSRVPSWAPRVAGASELLGALGLVLPAAVRIRPLLTPLAASGLVVVMILAAVWVHAPASEWAEVGLNVVLGGAAGFVAYGRLRLAPISAR